MTIPFTDAVEVCDCQECYTYQPRHYGDASRWSGRDKTDQYLCPRHCSCCWHNRGIMHLFIRPAS